ncbi:hypothetical protein MKZ38_009745 [Zalerion maritima]|uniref:Uncharacterized protein n=1 Tax=Zalerion maritima TaxID=339359 RepID=A0AAD5WVJ4_9PEZI|nr:hypothetical protein MKZ38_009745 [Zalerion maritima]
MADVNNLPQTSSTTQAPQPTAQASSSNRPSSSQQMPPPPKASSPSLNILPSNQSIVNNASGSSVASPTIPVSASGQAAQAAEVREAPGPLRHPRPMTAADLHHELEKEQEAVVNRLTRELSILRTAANASVASNTSSTSASHSTHGASGTPGESTHSHSHSHTQLPELHPLLSGTSGFTIPSTTGRMHHARTASNTSIRSTSASNLATAGSSTPAGPRANPVAIPLSRQSSQQSAHRLSRTSSPAPGSESFGTGLGATGAYFPSSSSVGQQGHGGHLSRYPYPSQIPAAMAQQAGIISGSSEQLSPGLLPATRNFEETAFYRAELDTVKRENDTLRKRIRELERMVKDRRASDVSLTAHSASRPRSESVSTTASVSVVAASGTTGGAGIAGPRGDSHARGREVERESKELKDSKDTTPPAPGPGAGAGPTISRPESSPSSLSRPDGLSARDRGVSSMSIASSVAVGVPEDEVENAARQWVLSLRDVREDGEEDEVIEEVNSDRKNEKQGREPSQAGRNIDGEVERDGDEDQEVDP